MSYQVIPRKYRPSDFDSIKGQQHVVKILKQSIESGRISHAYLFSGPRGVGKTTTARVLAKALNCESFDKPTSTPCGTCRNCREIKEGRSMDVIEIDGASNRGVDQIRDIIEHVKYAPVNSRYKIYIIDEVHMLTREAFNALLRTLEEPPPHVVFIFATTEPHKVIDTILSRCQRYDFRRLSVPVIVETLKSIVEKEKVEIKESDLYAIARKSNGGLRDAEVMLDQLLVYSGDKDISISDVLGILDISVLSELFLAVKNRDEKTIVALLDKMIFEGYSVDEISIELINFLRNLLYVKIGMLDFLRERIDEETLKTMKDVAQNVSSDYLEMILRSLVKFQADVRITPDPHLLFEITLLRLSHIDDLIAILSDGIPNSKKKIDNVIRNVQKKVSDEKNIRKEENNSLSAWYKDENLPYEVKNVLLNSEIQEKEDKIVINVEGPLYKKILETNLSKIRRILKKYDKPIDVIIEATEVTILKKEDIKKEYEKSLKENNPEIKQFMERFNLYIVEGGEYDGYE